MLKKQAKLLVFMGKHQCAYTFYWEGFYFLYSKEFGYCYLVLALDYTLIYMKNFKLMSYSIKFIILI